jgi:hypothetical protein
LSGKPWPPERKAAQAARLRDRWRRGAFRKRKPASIDDAERAARSARMAALNARMCEDRALKRKCVAGQKRVRRRKRYRALQGGRMRALMRDRPELRELARTHAARINRDPNVRRRQWATRRANMRKGTAAYREVQVELAAASLKRPPIAEGDALLAALRQHHGRAPQ